MANPFDRRFDEPASAERASELVLFCVRLLGGRYALEASLVSEVFRIGALTRLPSSPGFLPGVVAHRGEVLAVLDPHLLVGQPPLEHGPGRRAALVQHGKYRLALLCESVEGLVRVSTARIDAPPSTAQGVAEFLSGIAHDPKGPIAVLDLPKLVDVARSRSLA